jgi:hypothetical protein
MVSERFHAKAQRGRKGANRTLFAPLLPLCAFP